MVAACIGGGRDDDGGLCGGGVRGGWWSGPWADVSTTVPVEPGGEPEPTPVRDVGGTGRAV